MSYDLYPADTLETRKRLYEQAIAGDWVLGSSMIRFIFRQGPEDGFPVRIRGDLDNKFPRQEGVWTMKEVTIDELLAKAEKPSAEAMRLHAFYRGRSA